MTAPSSIDPAQFLHEQLSQASPDLLRQMLTTFINTLEDHAVVVTHHASGLDLGAGSTCRQVSLSSVVSESSSRVRE
jgi:hypothetical protein